MSKAGAGGSAADATAKAVPELTDKEVAAAAYHERELEAAEAAVESAHIKVERAEEHLAAAQDALTEAEAARAALED